MTAQAQARASVRRIAIFNHKGGVGKTTLTTNVAFALLRRKKRVLLIDSDPQCNLTSYLVEDAVVDRLLDQSDSDQGQTIWSAVKPVADGTGDYRSVSPIEVRDGLFLLPGDVRLAEFEQELHALWADCLLRKPRGFRGVVALSQLVNETAARLGADYVFYDSGPNIGALNRSILLDCDYFAIPAACDLFSVRAIRTLGVTLRNWVRDWKVISALAPDGAYLFPGEPRLLGYIPQRYRAYGGRPATEYARFIPMIERAVQGDVVELLKRVSPSLLPPRIDALKLGEVKDFGAAAPVSQRTGVPITEADNISAEQQQVAFETFLGIADEIIARTTPEPNAA
jgi:cellulose biosynthesis protein BcsQ